MRLSSIVWLAVVVCAAALLYSVKYRVQAMDEEIASLRRQIEVERAAVHVLQAEWAYLNRPERVRQLADMHLKMKAASGQQLMELADVPFSPEREALRLASESGQSAPYGGAFNAAPTPQFRPGVMPAGGVGHAR